MLSGLLIQAGALVFLTPAASEAAGRGAGHGGFGGGHGGFGGGHVGTSMGGHVGGASFGSNHGGFYGRPYGSGLYQHYGYGRYRPYYGGYYPYSAYPYYSYPYYGSYGSYYPDYAMPGLDDGGYTGSYSGDAIPPYADGSSSAVLPAAGYEELDSTAGTQSNARALVTVSLPEDAKLWFNNTLTATTGSVREFQSPPLPPGGRYKYQVRASWQEHGHLVTRAQDIEVTPHAHININFQSSNRPMAGAD
jgi:uncharacterized protein (TIGR03000 family)